MSLNSAASPAKFVFDLDMGKSREKSRIIGEYALADLLKKAEEKGYANGLADGETTATAAAAKSLGDDAQKLVMQANALQSAAGEMQKQNMADAVGLALSIARKLAGSLIARNPLGEIKELISECFSSLESVPHLVIRCHPDLADAVQKAAEIQVKTNGFAGRLLVMGEPEILLGDARLEWVDGGLVRDISKTCEQIDLQIKAFLDAPGSDNAAGSKNPGQPAETTTAVSSGPVPQDEPEKMGRIS